MTTKKATRNKKCLVFRVNSKNDENQSASENEEKKKKREKFFNF
jgi:hypothetical protein